MFVVALAFSSTHLAFPFCALEQKMSHRLPIPVSTCKLTQWYKVKYYNARHFIRIFQMTAFSL